MFTSTPSFGIQTIVKIDPGLHKFHSQIEFTGMLHEQLIKHYQTLSIIMSKMIQRRQDLYFYLEHHAKHVDKQ